MAKVPRAQRGSVPSAVTRGGPKGGETSGLLGLAAQGAGQLANIALGQEANAHNARVKALAKKQAILDEAEFGALLGDFNAANRDIFEETVGAFWDNPTDAEGPHTEALNIQTERILETASNTEVRLKLTKALRTKQEAAVEKMYQHTIARQTQIAGVQMTKAVNAVADAAKFEPNQESLEVHVRQAMLDLASGINAVYGKKAQEKLDEIPELSAQSYVNTVSREDPRRLSRELRSDRGPLNQYLTPTQRKVAISQADMGIKKRQATENFDWMVRATGERRDVADLLNSGDPEAIDAIMIKRRTARERLVDLRGSDKTVEQIAFESGELKEDIEFYDAMEQVHRSQRPYDAIDDDGTISEIHRRIRAVYSTKRKKARAGVSIQELKKLQLDIATAEAKGKMTRGTATTARKSLSGAVEKLRKGNIDATGGIGGFFQDYPRTAGYARLDARFAAKNVTPELQNRIEKAYLSQLNAKADEGTVVTEEMAEALADKMFKLEMVGSNGLKGL